MLLAMLGTRTIVPLLGCLFLAGCLEFPEPLGPVSESFIDARLLGSWSCVAPDDQRPATMTIVDFDGKQYYLNVDNRSDEPSHMRAHATRIGEVPFLNVIAIGGETRKPDWTLLEYSFPDASMRFRMVDPSQFGDDRESGARVRELLEEHLDDSEYFEDALSCTKSVPHSAVVPSEQE